jgi:large subunit ribosomal protein L23|tara:strand:- start:1293 stop:1580 length:288 start_codon:yes stop_codon:yes gene_type:complete
MKNLNQIKKPVITEKSTSNAQFNKYVFEVDMKSNKKDIKDIIESLYKVKVEKLNSLRTKSKPKVFKGMRGTRNETKRITVTLKKGNTIDMGAAVK